MLKPRDVCPRLKKMETDVISDKIMNTYAADFDKNVKSIVAPFYPKNFKLDYQSFINSFGAIQQRYYNFMKPFDTMSEADYLKAAKSANEPYQYLCDMKSDGYQYKALGGTAFYNFLFGTFDEAISFNSAKGTEGKVPKLTTQTSHDFTLYMLVTLLDMKLDQYMPLAAVLNFELLVDQKAKDFKDHANYYV